MGTDLDLTLETKCWVPIATVSTAGLLHAQHGSQVAVVVSVRSDRSSDEMSRTWGFRREPTGSPCHVRRGLCELPHGQVTSEKTGTCDSPFLSSCAVWLSPSSLVLVGIGFPSPGALALGPFRAVSLWVALPQPRPDSGVLRVGVWEVGSLPGLFCQHSPR